MFNLLPQEEQKKLERDSRLRFAAAGLILFISLGAVSLIALIPSFFLLREQTAMAQSAESALERDIALASKNKFFEVMSLAGEKVAALTASSSVPYDYELISDVLRDKTNEVQIMGVRVAANQSGGRDITVLGQATDRNSLLAFTNILERETDFSNVTVPVSNFADALNPKFSILIKVK